MENETPRAVSRTGFSLIEMLFVVAVIAILAGLMFPLAGSVRARAQRTSCLNNLRQWGLALNLYLDENRGKFPNWQGNSKLWYEELPPYVDQAPMSELVTFPGGGKKSMFLCPADVGDGTDHGDYYSSYTFNTHVSRTKGATHQHQIKNPDRFVVFSETPTGGKSGVDLSTLGRTKNGSSAFRHSGSVCFAFADGHAAAFRRAAVWRDGLSATDNFGGFQWNPENDDLENAAPEEQ